MYYPNEKEVEELKSLKIASFFDFVEDGWDWLHRKNEGYKLPWQSLSDKFSIVKGEMTIVSGYTGQGKSDFVNHVSLHCVKQGAKVFQASFELSGGNLAGRLFRQATGSIDPTVEYWTKFVEFYNNKIFIYDLLGNADIDALLKSCQKVYEMYGCDVFIFDNLMMLNKLADDYNKQLEVGQKLLKFCKTNKVAVILVAHSKKPPLLQHGQPFRPPGAYDVLGASGVVNMVDNHLSVSINQIKLNATHKQKAELDLSETDIIALSQGDAIIKRDKKREVGELFLKYLYFDNRFNVLKEFEDEKPKNYIEHL